MEPRDGEVVAAIHAAGISTGFASRLGARFLRVKYASLPRCPHAFGYVCCDDQGRVVGFVACVVKTALFYRWIMWHRFLPLVLAVWRSMLRPSFMAESIRRQSAHVTTEHDLPSAELLAIAVSAECRGGGVGTTLLAAACEAFAQRGIETFRLVVGTDNAPANAFYRKNGFELVATSTRGETSSNIYIRRTRPETPQQNQA